jgi:two-component system LytT family sensor kinase
VLVANAALAALSVGAAIWIYFRVRPDRGVPLEMVIDLLRAAPELRDGLRGNTAERITERLRSVLNCAAVGITDADGDLASWAGGAADHYADLEVVVDIVRTTRDRQLVFHTNLSCEHRGSCPMGTAVVVPIVVEGTTKAVLIVVGGRRQRRMERTADAVARFVSAWFELDRLEHTRSARLRAEVTAQRAQISPHFLYNALNTIAALVRKDHERTEELLVDLADFTRHTFRSGMFTTLAEELRNVDRYLAIESAQYGERLSFRLKADPQVLSVVVPTLVVQPLVENAVKHGLAPKPGGGTVTVLAEDAGTTAVLSVEDDGVGMDAERLFRDLRDAHRDGTHVGIGNINQRMKSVFGEEYALMVETAPGAGMKVIVRVPKFARGVRPDLGR